MNITTDYAPLIGKDNPLHRYCELYQAALTEFSQKPFESASLNNIIKDSRISKGSLYHHLGDKFGLYIALIDVILGVKAAINAKLVSELESCDSLFDALHLLIDSNVALLTEDRRIALLYSRFLSENLEFRQRIIDLLSTQSVFDLTAICERAISRGQVDSRYTPIFIQRVINILLGSFEQLLPTNYTIEDIVATTECLQQLIKQGLVAMPRKEGNER